MIVREGIKMTSRTHDVFAFASLITVAAYYPPSLLNPSTLALSLVGNIVGSLLPDIDQATNRLWDLLPAGDSLGRIFRKLFLAHRTLSHSFLGVFLVYKLLWWLLPKILNPNHLNITVILYATMIGFVSHLILDFFTEEGLPLFFPIKTKLGFPPISSWRITTGKWFEKLVVFPGIIVYSIWFAISNQEILARILKLVIR